MHMLNQPFTLKIVHKILTSITGMTAAMIIAAKEVDGMYWNKELRTASARRTTLPTMRSGGERGREREREAEGEKERERERERERGRERESNSSIIGVVDSCYRKISHTCDIENWGWRRGLI